MNLKRAFYPLDRARVAAYRAAAPLVSRVVGDRERRVALIGALVVVSALAATATAPLALLAWGPILLGVPHLLADVRYLVVRPALHRRLPLMIGVAAPLLLVSIFPTVQVGLAAVIGAIVFARAKGTRKAVGLVACALAFVVARGAGAWAELAFAHLHNLVALALWWAWRPRRRSLHATVPLLFAAATLAIFSGATDPILRALSPYTHALSGSLDVNALAAGIAPGGTLGAFHVLLFFVFAQSVHYGVWLRLVPEEDRARPTPRSFSQSYRALAAEFPPLALVLVALFAIGLAAYGAVDVTRARAGYLRLALFHGHMELALFALAWVEQRRPGERAAAEGIR